MAPREDARSEERFCANERHKRAAARRLGLGLLGALALLVVIALLGPDAESIRRRFDFAHGAKGPLRVMPELSIEPGRDPRHQEPAQFRKLWRPPPEQQWQERQPDAQPVPPPQPLPSPRPLTDDELAQDADLDVLDAVEMHLPQQTSPCFVIDRLVRPRYPRAAGSAVDRAMVVHVEVAFYVDPTGTVTASYVLNSDGDPAFAEIALKAVNQWRYRPLQENGCPPLGFWVRLPITFRNLRGQAGD